MVSYFSLQVSGKTPKRPFPLPILLARGNPSHPGFYSYQERYRGRLAKTCFGDMFALKASTTRSQIGQLIEQSFEDRPWWILQ